MDASSRGDHGHSKWNPNTIILLYHDQRDGFGLLLAQLVALRSMNIEGPSLQQSDLRVWIEAIEKFRCN